ncbi:MAG TPA: hypothetical protein VJK31_11715 [Chthoniobacterales bacterium]|nr:hypothetical protein [Chthoniobacterales bacterium]
MRVSWILPQLLDKLIAIHPGHEHIGDNQVRLFFADQLQRFFSAGGFDQAIVAGLQRRHEQCPVVFVIVNNDNCLHGRLEALPLRL